MSTKGILNGMSAKEIVTGLLERLPDDVTLEEFVRQLRFIAGVKEGFESYEREGGISMEEVREQIASWARTVTK